MASISTITEMRPISADSHIVEPPDCFIPNVDAKYRDVCPRIERDPKRGDLYVIPGMEGGTFGIGAVAAAGLPPRDIRMEGWKFEELHRGGWDPKARLIDMDRDGVAAEVVFPTVGMMLYSHPDIDYAHACLQAYNRWLATFVGGAPQRLFGVGMTRARNPKELVEDMRAFAKQGFKGVMMPEAPGEEDYDSKIYDPAWETAAELGLPLCFHILPGSRSSSSPMQASKPRGGRLNGFMGILRTNQDIIGVFIFGGVFDRHPKLKMICVEADAGWAPHYMYRMDHAYDRHRFWLHGEPLSRMPSEFFRENVYLTFQDDYIAYQTSHLANSERLLWASDYPHSDSTWPHSRETAVELTRGMDDKTIKRIVHDNSAELFRIELP